MAHWTLDVWGIYGFRLDFSPQLLHITVAMFCITFGIGNELTEGAVKHCAWREGRHILFDFGGFFLVEFRISDFICVIVKYLKKKSVFFVNFG